MLAVLFVVVMLLIKRKMEVVVVTVVTAATGTVPVMEVVCASNLLILGHQLH